MNRERILSILYDLASTIGGEVQLESLLTKIQQRLLFHTNFPCGMILLDPVAIEGDACSLTMATAIGDRLIIDHLGASCVLPAACMPAHPKLIPADMITSHLPCRQDHYQTAFFLPIPNTGACILLSPSPMQQKHVEMEPIFTPILGHLSRAIHLCRISDEQKESLGNEVREGSRRLKESEEYTRLLLESTAEAIYGVDTEGRCTFVNQAFMDLLAHDERLQLIGQSMHALIHHRHADGGPCPESACMMAQAYSRGDKLQSIQDTFWRKDGTPVSVQYSIFPIMRDGKHIGSVTSFQDITERLEAAREKEEIRIKVENNQRLESLGILAGGIAHDFNNILTAIMGNASLAKKRLGEHAAVTDFIEPILDASQSAADLCRQMLAYAGKGRFVVKPISLSEMVRHMSKLLEVSIGKGVALKFDLDESLPAIKADISQIQQVIMNLITNANEAIGERNGVIGLRTGVQSVDRHYLEHQNLLSNAMREGDYIFLEVSDNGAGIPADAQMKIFEPFYSTKETGRGLGMSAIQGIVRGHGGGIKIYSELGKGTTFKVIFPISDESSSPIVEQRAPSSQWRPQGTILVIDDEAFLRGTTTAILENIGFDVVTAIDGRDGLAQYKRHRHDIAAILLDMNMPVMNGESTFRALRMLNPDIKVILTSGYNEQDATQYFIGRGLAGFVQKPYTPGILESKLREILS